MVNQTISHYNILEKLGEGGMGVVYKAQDLKLDRLVALKFLPHHLTASEAERARLLQEAKSAAALNHPHICTIYSIEDVSGEQFIAMEFVDGVTLREKIHSTHLTPKSAIEYAIQIGEALQEAHNAGIVHRDIKPENIMVSSKNQIKVMDFGLAKLKGSLKLTKTSSTVGTLAYMAPEQIQGQETDVRSDIFSFGIVLFETLTGRLPFRGEHEAAMMYSIVNEEPQEISNQLPDVSPIVSNLIQRCLEKDPDERYQHFDDITADLRRAQKKTTRVLRSSASIPTAQLDTTASSAGMSTPTGISKLTVGKKPLLLIGSAVVGVAIIALAYVLLSGPSLPEVNPNAKKIRLSINVREHSFPAISPDGRWLAFMGADGRGKWDLYLRFLDTEETKRLTTDSSDPGPAGVTSAKFSPDGGTIAYTRWSSSTRTPELCLVSVLGGIPRVLARNAHPHHWHPDGSRIGFMRPNRVYAKSVSGHSEYWSVRVDGTDERLEFIDSLGFKPTGNVSFAWSPAGDKIVYNRTMGMGRSELVVHQLDNSSERVITQGGVTVDEMIWLDNGFILCSWWKENAANLWLISDDGESSTQVTHVEGVIGSSISADLQRLVYITRKTEVNLWRSDRNGTNLVQLVAHGNLPVLNTVLSLDKSQIAFTDWVSSTSGKRKMTIALIDRNGENKRNLVSPPDSGDYLWPLFSSDGQRVAYTHRLATMARDENQIYVVDRQGSVSPKLVTSGRFAFAWTDEKTVAVLRNNGTYLVDIETGEQRRISSDSVLARPVLAGKYIAHRKVSNEVRVARWDGISLVKENSGAVIASLDKDRIANFLFGEKYMTFVNADREVWNVDYVTLRRTRVSALRPELRSYIVNSSFDGSELVVLTNNFATELVMLEHPFK